MRSLILAALLLLVTSILASPTPGGKDDKDDHDDHKDDHKDDYKKDHRTKTVKKGQTIQEVIKSAKPGDTIIVPKGTYSEHLTITQSGITLIGKDAILQPPNPDVIVDNLCYGLNRDFANAPTSAGICIQGTNFELADFVQEHRKVRTVGTYISNVVVSGFTVQGFSGENIAVVGGSNVRVSHNTLSNGPQYGFLTVGSKSTLAEGNTVSGGEGGFIAMCMDDEADAKFKGNDISGYYIALCTQTKGGLVKENKVKDCCIGVFVDPNIDGAKVVGNTITDSGKLCPGDAGAGVIISGAKNTLVEGNKIEGMRNNGKGVGISVGDDPVSGAEARGNVVKGNKLKDNDVDIFTDAKAMDTVFKGNKCETSAPGDYCE